MSSRYRNPKLSLQELQHHYHTKRQPIYDAIELKSSRAQAIAEWLSWPTVLCNRFSFFPGSPRVDWQVDGTIASYNLYLSFPYFLDWSITFIILHLFHSSPHTLETRQSPTSFACILMCCHSSSVTAAPHLRTRPSHPWSSSAFIYMIIRTVYSIPYVPCSREPS